ncbi:MULTISPECIES: hypothetical protein [Microbacterium]|uniref:hypothetical protein n=1 Tax=Microbacterium TaxID=33882 RepID=UPI000B85B0D2|nr:MULTISPECIES: hypothetical protein [Microbacterium]NJI60362.1 hypothetical protein [Microbacterium sp. B19(2022)]
MRSILYGGDEFLTGDDIADALLEYGRALGEEERAEIVEIPVREQDGTVVSAKFLIGPASQIVAKAISGSGPELEDPELVRRLQALTRGVESPSGPPLDAPEGQEYELG